MSCHSTGLHLKPEFGRYAFYKLLTAIPVSAALIAIIRHSDSFWWALVYGGLCLLHAGIMFTIKCPHCAYYKMEGRRHRCFMIWGVPKVYRARSSPETKIVGVYAPTGMLALTVYPLFWLRFQWELLVIYLLSILVLLMSITLHDCPRCLNFECSHNRVPEEVREDYRASSGVNAR